MVTGEVEVAVAVAVGVWCDGRGRRGQGPVGPHDSRRGARWSVRAAHHRPRLGPTAGR